MQSSRDKKRICIVPMGYIHRDPASAIVLMDMITRFHQNKIKVVFCEEDTVDQTLERRIEGNKIFIEYGQKMLTNPDINKLLIKNKNLSYSYFPLDATGKITDILSHAYPQVKPVTINTLTTSLMRKNYYPESIKLSYLLKQLNIHYTGIEASLIEHEKMLSRIKAEYLSYEQSRVKNMTTNTFSKGLAECPDQGVLIVYGGMNHVQRLAANIYKYYHETESYSNEYDIQIFPLIFFSPYVNDGMEAHLDSLKLTRQEDSKDILDIYNILPVTYIHLKEVNGKFESDELDKIEEKIYEHIKPISFCIPDWSDKKKDIILNNNGYIINDENIEKTGYAVIHIPSKTLLKDIREQLGIDRQLLTLTGDTQAKVKFLKDDKAITIEKTDTKNKFLVTFPLDKLELVTKVVKDWKSFSSQQQLWKNNPEQSNSNTTEEIRPTGNTNNK